MTRQDLKKNWHILKALKKGWVEPSDVELYSVIQEMWIEDKTVSDVLRSN
jgi:hypothetical protein